MCESEAAASARHSAARLTEQELLMMTRLFAAGVVAIGLTGCFSSAQVQPLTVAQATPVAGGSAMPAPQAPFDETPITPAESAGASQRE
jgi:hypothetical protein